MAGSTRGRRRRISTETLRSGLSRALPARIRATLDTYEAFAAGDAPDEAKGYAAHHAACKAALQHAEMLVKLLRWAEDAPETGAAAEADDLERLLARAREAVADEEDGEEDDEHS